MLDREFDDFLAALESYKTDIISEQGVAERQNPSRVQLKISDNLWRQNLQNILHLAYKNLTGVGAVQNLLSLSCAIVLKTDQ